MNKKMNKRAYELLKNLEILCFIDNKKITYYFNYLKNNIFKEKNEKDFMEYFENVWIKRYKNLFNYYHLINDILKIKNLYINNKGNANSEKTLISKLKNLNKLYTTNNICESIHGKIANYLSKGKVSKVAFRDTMNFILKEYLYKTKGIVRRDYNTRTIIILIEKFQLNYTPKFIVYKTYQTELQKTVSIMTGKININAIDELISGLDKLENKNDGDILNVNEIITEKLSSEENDGSIDYIPDEKNIENDSLINEVIAIDEVLNDESIENENSKNISIDLSDNKSEFTNEDLQFDNNFDNVLNINEINEERGALSLFTLEITKNLNKNIKSILLTKNEIEIESIENKINDIDIKENSNVEKQKIRYQKK